MDCLELPRNGHQSVPSQEEPFSDLQQTRQHCAVPISSSSHRFIVNAQTVPRISGHPTYAGPHSAEQLGPVLGFHVQAQSPSHQDRGRSGDTTVRSGSPGLRALVSSVHSALIVNFPCVEAAPVVRKQLLFVSPRHAAFMLLARCERADRHDEYRANELGLCQPRNIHRRHWETSLLSHAFEERVGKSLYEVISIGGSALVSTQTYPWTSKTKHLRSIVSTY